jgi:hypothetical protein
MVSRVEKKQPRKQQAETQGSELDETAVSVSQPCLVRRRMMLIGHPAETNSDLSCSASLQQRNKDTIASLNAEVTNLHKTIEKLNAYFLTFTDDLVASGWLEQDPQATESLQKTIEHFITVVRASHVLKKDNASASDYSDLDQRPRSYLFQRAPNLPHPCL